MGQDVWDSIEGYDASYFQRSCISQSIMYEPQISIIVPSRGRPDRLATLIRHLAEQDLDAGQAFELIVALDGDAAEVDALPQSSDFALHYIDLPQVGIAAAKNAAASRAVGQVLLFVNDDIEPEHDFVREHLAAQIAGHRVVLGDSPWRRYADQAVLDELVARTRMIFFYGDLHAHKPCNFRHAWNLNLSVNRELLGARAGAPFDERFRPCMYEDIEMAYRIVGERNHVTYHPAARARHNHRYTLAGYFEREAMLGVMAPELFRANPSCFEAIFRCGLDALVAAARHGVALDVPDALRVLDTLMGWTGRPAQDCPTEQLDVLYHLHLPLKRRAFRLGLLAGARRPAPPWPRRWDIARGALHNDEVFGDLIGQRSAEEDVAGAAIAAKQPVQASW